MGLFIYGTSPSIHLEDRVLAHLRLVVMNKLRRSEPFMLDIDTGEIAGRRSLWMHASVPIQFHFHGSREPRINHHWVEQLMRAANGASGLTLLPEPDDTAGYPRHTERPRSRDVSRQSNKIASNTAAHTTSDDPEWGT
ncbi:hypothetical protein CVS54_00348 [Microbacterium oxydans]|uniref:DUF7882 domain-containing protein n=1 Tax=Microbacterium oxydans TaxID=82380 RepID=A0A3S9WG36_9MICO|nr:ATP-dependent DNA ligase [Microbacterium oxydans]AZS39048.1 hypothetical protein CVS54_00348 [Microbacterium oxydans]